MLRLAEKDTNTTTTTAVGQRDVEVGGEGDGVRRVPSHLGILRSQRVDQEVSWLPSREGVGEGDAVEGAARMDV